MNVMARYLYKSRDWKWRGTELQKTLDFIDPRPPRNCLHCGKLPARKETTKDHVPSKCLLNPGFPANLTVVNACRRCNEGFARDEQYFAAFLASVISGSTSPDSKRFPAAAKTLARQTKLRRRIDRSRDVVKSADGDRTILWTPENERLERVLVKNARGHVWSKTGQVIIEPPLNVGISPIQSMSAQQLHKFENSIDSSHTDLSPWPEVGSRELERAAIEWLPRLAAHSSWVTVQDGVYRYSVDDLSTVRIALREYLAVEVAWGEEDEVIGDEK